MLLPNKPGCRDVILVCRQAATISSMVVSPANDREDAGSRPAVTERAAHKITNIARTARAARPPPAAPSVPSRNGVCDALYSTAIGDTEVGYWNCYQFGVLARAVNSEDDGIGLVAGRRQCTSYGESVSAVFVSTDGLDDRIV